MRLRNKDYKNIVNYFAEMVEGNNWTYLDVFITEYSGESKDKIINAMYQDMKDYENDKGGNNMKWVNWVSGIDRLFVEIWATGYYILYKRGKPIGINKHIITKKEVIDSIGFFIRKHSNDNHDLVECMEQAELIFEKLEKGEKIR